MKTVLSVALLLLFASACTDDRSCCVVTLSISVPENSGDVYLTGNLPELGPWTPDLFLMEANGNRRTAQLHVPSDTDFEYKFTLGSWSREAVDEAGRALPNFEVSVQHDATIEHTISRFKPDPMVYIDDWQGSGVQGTLVYWTNVLSQFLGPSRHVSIWLPPGYDAARASGYPVLYMHDGHALFDPRIGGGSQGDIWDVDDAVVSLVEQDRIPPIIVVGVWNSEQRMTEYSPWHDAPDYARFLIEELMPRVNEAFNTATGPENTAVMGSSMGGLLSYYLVTYHPDVFGSCGCISSAFILSEELLGHWVPQGVDNEKPDDTPYIVRDIEAGLKAPGTARYWFDYGTIGGDADYDVPHRHVRKWLLGQGFEEGRDFVIRAYVGADHNEAAWRARLKDPLLFIYGEPAD